MDKTPWLTAQGIGSYDLNNMPKDAQKGLAWLTSFILGNTGPFVTGFTPSQTSSPSLSINIAEGQIYQLAAADATPIGSFAADSTQIMQQGHAAAQTIALNTSGLTSGQSKWWLIQAQFQQVDQVRVGDPTGGRRGFYNSANPASPLDGVNGLGGTIPTVRLGFANITAISGVAAASGSNVPPNPSAGCVPLFLVNVSFGQTTITTGQIQLAGPAAYAGYQQAPFLAGLLSQHHLGIPGTAPPIDLTKEVQNILPLPHLPVTNSNPPALGRSITLAGTIPVESQGTVNPNGNVAGNQGDLYFEIISGSIVGVFYCTTTGSSSTAVWQLIVGVANSVYVNSSPYNVTSPSINLIVNATSGPITINLQTINSTLAANVKVTKIDSSTNAVTIVPNGSQTIQGVSSYVITRQYVSVNLVPDIVNNNWINLGSTIQNNLKVFTSSGSYTPTPGTKYILVEVVGAGGGGAGANGQTSQGEGGGGGGGGSLARALLPTAGLTFPATITIGSGGTGGSSSATYPTGLGSGSNGTNSSFSTPEIGTNLTGYAGEGGFVTQDSTYLTGVGGRGGGAFQSAALTGNITINSVNYPFVNIFGHPGESITSAGLCGSANGGNSPLGGGGRGGVLGGAGQSGGYGGGGGGASFNNATVTAGGNGGSGIVLVTEYIGS